MSERPTPITDAAKQPDMMAVPAVEEYTCGNCGRQFQANKRTTCACHTSPAEHPTPQVWNPSEHGIRGVPLMIPAHDYNRMKSDLERQLADARETIAMYQESKSRLPQRESQSSLRRQLAELQRENHSAMTALSRYGAAFASETLSGSIVRVMEVVDAYRSKIPDLERQLAEARDEINEWKTLQGWGGTPEIINAFVKGQQSRIHAAQDIERQLADALAHLRIADGQLALERGALAEAREQRDALAEALKKACAHPVCGNWYKEAQSALDAVKENPNADGDERREARDIVNP